MTCHLASTIPYIALARIYTGNILASFAVEALVLKLGTAANGKQCAAGDQADQKLLDTILADSKDFNGYDVIIDDGGHTVNQMLTSIKVLPFKASFRSSPVLHGLNVPLHLLYPPPLTLQNFP